MCQLSNKQPPSIIFFILNSKNFVVILISSNKLFFRMLLRGTWECTSPLCMNYSADENLHVKVGLLPSKNDCFIWLNECSL